MIGEINRDFYCSAGSYNEGFCDDVEWADNSVACEGNGCKNYHRKWPTPEQFTEEYGFEWRGAVYTRCRKEKPCGSCNAANRWVDHVKGLFPCSEEFRVVACTPWGKPPAGWRPE